MPAPEVSVIVPGWNVAACDDGYTRLSPVGRFTANRFGLHDTAGNVFELTEDCWHRNYDGAPTDGSAWNDDGSCDRIVMRGGAWTYNPRLLASASRLAVPTGLRTVNLGFRVAKTIGQ